jgi:hypothetical protein
VHLEPPRPCVFSLDVVDLWWCGTLLCRMSSRRGGWSKGDRSERARIEMGLGFRPSRMILFLACLQCGSICRLNSFPSGLPAKPTKCSLSSCNTLGVIVTKNMSCHYLHCKSSMIRLTMLCIN